MVKKKNLIFIVVGIILTSILIVGGDTISIQIVLPEENAMSDDELFIVVNVKSSAEVKNVVASVEDRIINLVFSDSVPIPNDRKIPAWAGL